MDREKLNKAARIEREKVCNDLRSAYEIHKDIQHYVTASACIEKYAVDLFIAGTDWLMQQPLSERLTEEEKEKIKEIYWQAAKDWIGIGDAREYCRTCIAIETIFGKDLFNDNPELLK